MGLKFIDKESIVVDCRAARNNNKLWTLVNNITKERVDCWDGRDALEKLRNSSSSVMDYLGKLEKAVEQEKDDKYKERTCFVGIEYVPAILNLLDASDHVVEWEFDHDHTLSHDNCSIFRINYKSDRQLLFQDGDKVVFREEDPETPAHKEGVE